MNQVQNPGGLQIDPCTGRMSPTGKTPQEQDLARRGGESPFREIVQKELNCGQGLRFSAHAQDRLTSRDIQLTPDAMGKLTDAVDRVASKGAQNALMLMPGASHGNDVAFVVSVTNRTVITAVDGKHIRENIFTNIDSAVVV